MAASDYARCAFRATLTSYLSSAGNGLTVIGLPADDIHAQPRAFNEGGVESKLAGMSPNDSH